MTPSEQATALFKDGYNCSQAVFTAWCNHAGLDASTAQSVAAGFGGGFGRMQLTCGAVSGAVMALGMHYFDENDRAASKELTYNKVREFIGRFTQLHRTTECLRLMGVDIATPQGHDYAVDNNLFTTRCATFVRDSVTILESMLPTGPTPS